jgi:hypothetical protein
MTFRDHRAPEPGIRCPVLKCIWNDPHDYSSTLAMEALDNHMVEKHPTTEWAKRVLARRAARGLTP